MTISEIIKFREILQRLIDELTVYFLSDALEY